MQRMRRWYEPRQAEDRSRENGRTTGDRKLFFQGGFLQRQQRNGAVIGRESEVKEALLI